MAISDAAKPASEAHRATQELLAGTPMTRPPSVDTSSGRQVTANAVPNPGSPEAIAKGCKCPVIDNGHGRGWLGQPNVFVYSGACPFHCPADALTPGAPS